MLRYAMVFVEGLNVFKIIIFYVQVYPIVSFRLIT